MSEFQPPLRPRSGSILTVLVIARISTVHQDKRSLADQIALCENHVRERYDGPIRFVHIQGQGSGEALDRRELADAEAAIESRAYDLVVTEDLGRICRRNRAVDFCELAEDADTRLVAINDSLDTADDNWRLSAFFATFKHESSNKDTSKRIRRTLRHRFTEGGVAQTFPYGYIKAPGAKSDEDVRKDPAAVEIYEEWASRLEAGESYSQVADWLNERKVPTGEWARNERWDGRMVARVIHNPILKGFRRRNERKSRRVNKSGRSRSVKAAPGELLLRHAPHLQFLEPARWDRLIAALARRHAGCARGRKAGTMDGRAGVPKKRTVWPGQHVVCGVCGHLYYWGGHGQTDHMMCAAARDYACWNAATFDGHEAGRRVAAAVLAAAETLPAFDDAFRAKVAAAAGERQTERVDALARLTRDLLRLDRELANLSDAVMKMGFSVTLQAKLTESEGRKAQLEAERAALVASRVITPELPAVEELKSLAREQVGRLAFCAPEFGRLMSRLVPRLEVRPYRCIDGGKVVLRAHATVTLAPLGGADVGTVAAGLLSREVVIDLFDPPQRVAFRERVVALREAGLTERKTAAQLGLTVTAAQRAMELHRLMTAGGVTDPYLPLVAPPDGETKFSRHRHPRYQFCPLPGYPLGSPFPA